MIANVRDLEEQLHQKSKLSDSLLQSFEEEKRTNTKLSERNERLSHQLADQKIENERDLNSLKQDITEVRHQKNQIQHQLDHMKQDLKLINEHKNKLSEENLCLQKHLHEKTFSESMLKQKYDQYSRKMSLRGSIETA